MSQEIYAEFFDRFGLNKLDQEVYGVLIGKGVMTPGEINETLGNKGLIEVLESLRDLVDFGLVSVVGEKIKRYYANFPFLREILTVEREAIISLASLIESIDEKQKELEEKRNFIKEVTLPMFINQLLDSYYSNVLEPLRDTLLSKQDDLDEISVKNVKAIQDFRDILKEEITKMAVPLEQLTKLSGTKMTLALTEEEDGLLEFVKKRKAERISLLKNIHFQLGNYFKTTEKHFDEINGAISENLERLKEKSGMLAKNVQMIKDTLDNIKSMREQETKRHAQLMETLLLSREALVKNIKETIADPVQAEQLERLAREKFDELGSLIEKPDLSHFVKAEDQLSPIANQLPNELRQVEDAIKSTETNAQNKLLKTKQEFKNTLNKIGGILTEVNQKDDESLIKLREDIQEQVKGLTKRVASKTNEVREQLKEIEGAMVQSVHDAFAAYEKDLLDAFNRPKQILLKYIEDLKEVGINEKELFETQVHSALEDYLMQLRKEEEEAMLLLKERIEFAKTMVEGRSLDLRKILRATEKIQIKVPVDNGVVVGLPAIYASITDLLLRARRRVTLITPTFDSTLFGLAISLVRNSPSTRVTIVTHIPPGKRKKELERAKEFGTILIYNYEEKDLYACFRDDEEIVFGYKKEGEEVSAIRSASYSMVELFKDRVNETVIRKSKRLV